MATLCVIGSNSGRNAGDAAILSSIVHNLRRLRPATRFEVPAPRARDIAARFPSDLVRPVPMMPWNLSLRLVGWTTARSIARADAVLITDGIIFDVKLLNPLFNFLILLAAVVPFARLLGKPVVGLLIGVGPLRTRLGRRLAAMVCRRCERLYVREDASRDLLTAIGVDPARIEVFADAAFVNPPARPERVDAILAEHGLTGKDRLLGINLNAYLDRWLDDGRRVDARRFADAMVRAIDRLIVEDGREVALILTQIMDIDFAQRLVGRLARPDAVRVLGNDRYTSEELMGVMGRMRVFVGMRLHSLILATAMDVPCVGLAYAPKVRHFMAQMDVPDMCLELDTLSADALTACVRAADDDAFRRRYAERAAEWRRRADAGFRAFADRFLGDAP